MKRNTNLNFALMIFAVLFCLMSFVFEANAQTRRRRPVRKPAATSTAKPPVNNAAELKEGAQKVSTQLKNVSKFIYIFGGIAKNADTLNADAKAKITPGIVQSIKNLQAGLAALETDFRTKNSLRIYAPWVDGTSGLAATAAQQASAGQMNESGNTLLQVVEKLSDALAALP